MVPVQTVPRESIENKSPEFDRARLMDVRDRSWKILEEIASRIHVGMTEEAAYEMAKTVIAEAGALKNWHRPYVRFGRNTTRSYGEPSEPGVVLGASDLFFIDIGPVWDGYEGDVGRGFVVGSDPDYLRCCEDAREIFELTQSHWRETGATGEGLYAFAEAETRKRGWLLVRETNGHRLSDFPHAAYYKGSLSEVDFSPGQYAWVLEIQIRHPEKEFGVFYEDLLL